MTPDVAPAPGSLTVPPFFGWEGIVVLVLTAVVVGVAFLLVGALGTERHGSSEWQEWLDGRSRPRLDPVSAAPVGESIVRPDPSDGPASQRLRR